MREDAHLLVELNAVILKACASETRHRYGSAAELCSDLQRIEGGTSIRRQHAVERWKPVVWRAAAAITILTMAVIAGKALIDKRLTREKPYHLVVIRQSTPGSPEHPLRHFAVGLTEALQEIPGLRVPGYKYAYRVKDPKFIGADLGKFPAAGQQLVLSLTKTNDSFELRVQLRKEWDDLFWSNQYRFAWTNAAEIATQLVHDLEAPLGLASLPVEIQSRATRHFSNHFAAELSFSQGTAANLKGGTEDLSRAIAHFTTALGLCPRYLDAYTGLAFTYRSLSANERAAHEARGEFRRNILQAISIDAQHALR